MYRSPLNPYTIHDQMKSPIAARGSTISVVSVSLPHLAHQFHRIQIRCFRDSTPPAPPPEFPPPSARRTAADPFEIHSRRPGPQRPAHRSSPTPRTLSSGHEPSPRIAAVIQPRSQLRKTLLFRGAQRRSRIEIRAHSVDERGVTSLRHARPILEPTQQHRPRRDRVYRWHLNGCIPY